MGDGEGCRLTHRGIDEGLHLQVYLENGQLQSAGDGDVVHSRATDFGETIRRRGNTRQHVSDEQVSTAVVSGYDG